MKINKRLPLETILMETIKDMVFVVSMEEHAQFRYAFINRAVMAKTAFDESIIGKTMEEALPREQFHFFREIYMEAFTTRQKVYYEDAFLSPDGEIRYASSEVIPLFDDGGKEEFIVCITTDITNERVAQLETKETAEHLQENQARHLSLFENNSDAVFTLELDGTILTGNPAVNQLSGCRMEELSGRNLAEFLPLTQKQFTEKLKESVNIHQSVDTRLDFRHRSGKSIGVLLKIIPIHLNAKLVGLYAILKDMRELDKLVTLLSDSENKFRLIAEHVSDTILLADETGIVSFTSPSIEEVYGFLPDEVIGRTALSFVGQRENNEAYREFERAFTDKITTSFQLPIKHKSGKEVWSDISITPVFDKQRHILIISRDITLQKERETQLRHFAYHDPLTGIANRRLFTERLSARLAQFNVDRNPFAIALFDIDRFKSINDQFGHEAGDFVIRDLGQRLQQNIGEHNIAARLGGDEFVIMIDSIGELEAVEAIYREISDALQQPWMYGSHPLSVAVSAGFSIVSGNVEPTVSAILQNADKAMYEAKKAGGNGLVIHHWQSENR